MAENVEPYWEDAKSGVVYVSPSLLEFHPKFADVPVERKKKTKEFEFISSNQREGGGTFVQDLGMMSEKISLVLYFAGPLHHSEALAFEQALAEYGPAKLYLPHDPNIAKKVILLKYKRVNRYVEDAARTVFTVDFRETRVDGYGEWPTGTPFNISAEYVNAASQYALANVITEESFLSKAADSARKGLDAAKAVFTPALELVSTANTTFNSIYTSIDAGLSGLLEQPLVLASQIQSLLAVPIFPNVNATLAAYEEFVSYFENDPLDISKGLAEDLAIRNVYGVAGISQMAVKVTSTDFSSRSEAVDALSRVKDSYNNYLNSLIAQERATADFNLADRFFVDPAVYEALYSLLQQATGNVDKMLVGLKREATFEAEQDVSPLTLASRYYPDLFRKDPNSALDAFEKGNRSNFDEILLIEKGKEYTVFI